MRLIVHFLILAGLFLGLFLGLSRIPFTETTGLEKLGEQNSRRIGEMLVESMLLTRQEVTSPEARAIVDSLKTSLCRAGDLDPDSIRIHLIRDEEVNAFALPGNHIILNTGLFAFAESADEVAGVLGHELGHLKRNHIERKMIKEVGLTLLFTIAGGEGGQVIVNELLRMISSTSFDREYEEEADAFAVETMAKAGADPGHLSGFMLRISQEQNLPEELVFLSTHPDSKSRAARIIELAADTKVAEKPLLRTTWNGVQETIR